MNTLVLVLTDKPNYTLYMDSLCITTHMTIYRSYLHFQSGWVNMEFEGYNLTNLPATLISI